MAMTKVLLIGEITKELKSLLKQNSYSFSNDLNNLGHYSALIVRGGHPIDHALLSKMNKLQVIIVAGIGYDNIDFQTVKKMNIYVANCPSASTISTAEHSFALFLAGTKRIIKADKELKADIWNRSQNINHEIHGKEVAIIGLGKIGTYVANLYRALGLDVYAYDPYISTAQFKNAGVIQVSKLKDLIGKVNYLSLHAAKTDETTNLINKKLVTSLKKPNGIVNTCRGGIVSEEIIRNSLDTDVLDFYAADVFEDEPNTNMKLISNTKVISSPHIAANTLEAQQKISKTVVTQLRQVFKENIPPSNLIK